MVNKVEPSNTSGQQNENASGSLGQGITLQRPSLSPQSFDQLANECIASVKHDALREQHRDITSNYDDRLSDSKSSGEDEKPNHKWQKFDESKLPWFAQEKLA